MLTKKKLNPEKESVLERLLNFYRARILKFPNVACLWQLCEVKTIFIIVARGHQLHSLILSPVHSVITGGHLTCD